MPIIYLDLYNNAVWHRCYSNEYRSYYQNGQCPYEKCGVKIPFVLLAGLSNQYENDRNLFYTDKHAYYESRSSLAANRKLYLIDETLLNK